MNVGLDVVCGREEMAEESYLVFLSYYEELIVLFWQVYDILKG